MPFTEDQLKKIAAGLPRGYSKTLAEKFDMAPGSIRNIINGLANNEEVVLAALDLAEKHRSRVEAAINKLSPAE